MRFFNMNIYLITKYKLKNSLILYAFERATNSDKLYVVFEVQMCTHAENLFGSQIICEKSCVVNRPGPKRPNLAVFGGPI